VISDWCGNNISFGRTSSFLNEFADDFVLQFIV